MKLFAWKRRMRQAGAGRDDLEAHHASTAHEAEGDSEREERIEGERSIISVNRVQSLQSRVSSVLAIALMSVLGVGLLGWYYRQMLARPARAQAQANTEVRNRAQGDMPLPPLGRIDPPAVHAADEQMEANRAAEVEGMWARLMGPPPADPRSEPTLSAEQISAVPSGAAPGVPADRRLGGAVFVARQAGVQVLHNGEADDTYIYESAGSAGVGGPGAVEPPGSGELAARLRPTSTPAARAQVLPTRRLLLPKGAFLDCTLETAIDSSLPGMATCVMASDSFSADGTVVLLERGTKLVGETSAQVRQGSSRVFVLWTQARTPSGVVVPLDSPGADELGRAGLPGEVNRHFWERFGAAILISVIDGAAQAAVQPSGDGDAVVINPASSQSVMTEVLKSTVNIPPTVVKKHGDRVQVLVARDLDFRSVYELRAVAQR